MATRVMEVRAWRAVLGLAALTGCASPVGVVEQEEAVLVPRSPPTYVPVDTVIRCDRVRTATSVCWTVTDSVTGLVSY